MSRRKTTAMTAADKSAPAPPGKKMTEEEYRQQFEPVAPWKWSSIPDYGPLKDHHHLLSFAVVGIAATLGYEYSGYFDQIERWVAYFAIWFPLWFRLLGRVAPVVTEEELEQKEREDFHRELERIQKEAEQEKED
ncbi:TPA: hypothetical protein N0F65_011359 [Lagenidium giganteum]|uniref:Uncharacterized protein n=1 Tax=Lagenidium giganteum TaxID=4803 RepID=A0AAV2Z2L5_9STRA|nr:TPA: hypothetical protein N0F65_011359 [Lagenidium giganteum]